MSHCHLPAVSKRKFLQGLAAAGLGTLAVPLLPVTDQAVAQIGPGALDPTLVRKFVTPLPNPLNPALPGVHFPVVNQAVTLTIRETVSTMGTMTSGASIDSRVWGYGLGNAATTVSPGPTFEVNSGVSFAVNYVNGLDGVPNRLPVDTTLDWPNPGGVGGLAPVPLVAHLHGGNTQYLSDGLPDAWSTPGETWTGRLFNKPYRYDNNQEAGHLWYHDHTRGITRTNVYMGLAGHYFVRDKNEAIQRVANILPAYPYEVPLLLQDKQFLADGTLVYPAADLTTPGLPSPTHLPEFFGDVLLVNGKIWPKLTVERRKYRFRVLNGSDSRFYALKIQGETPSPNGYTVPSGVRHPIWVIGNELGLLNRAALANWNTPGGISQTSTVLIAPGERYDLIVDFSAVPVGTRLLLWNDAATPYTGDPPDGVDYTAPEPGLTDRVMAFDVVPRIGLPNATMTLNMQLRLTAQTAPLPITTAGTAAHRKILLYEGTDSFGRLQTMMGPVDPVTVGGVTYQGTLTFTDPITELPRVNTTEVWEFHNTTADAHPIHMHLVDFRILNRQKFSGTTTERVNPTDGSNGATLTGITLDPVVVPPEPWFAGKKDTVIAYPGHVTRVVVNFKKAGEYVYHCHILSHEDHEMMRPYRVV
jgi:spore coat protein A, manganese oxidase